MNAAIEMVLLMLAIAGEKTEEVLMAWDSYV